MTLKELKSRKFTNVQIIYLYFLLSNDDFRIQILIDYQRSTACRKDWFPAIFGCRNHNLQLEIFRHLIFLKQNVVETPTMRFYYFKKSRAQQPDVLKSSEWA